MCSRLHKVVVLGVAFFLLTFKIDQIPGLHGDEGWSLLLSRSFAEGERPFTGMNYYTGTLFQFLAMPLFELFGYSLQTLRSISAICNLGAVALFMGAIDSLPAVSGSRSSELGSAGLGERLGWLIGTLPIFVVMSRFAVEVTALSPVLDAGALYLLASTAFGVSVSCLIAGAFLALASYSHILNLTFVGALAFAAVLTWGKSAVRDRRAQLTLASFAALYLPALALALHAPEFSPGFTSKRLSALFSFSFLRDLPHLPRALWEMWEGRILYLHTTGDVLLPVAPYATLIALFLLGLAVVPWLRKSPRPALDPLTRFLAIFFASDLLLTLVAAPFLSERYFELPLLLFAGLLVWVTRRSERMAFAALILFAAMNIFYLGGNYFHAFSRSGGKVASFPMGARAMEASSHFIDKELLIAQLEKNRISTVITDFVTRNALLAARIDRPTFEVMGILDFSHPVFSWAARGRAAIVSYNGPTPIDVMVVDPPAAETIPTPSGQTFRRDSSYDRRFLVYVSDGF